MINVEILENGKVIGKLSAANFMKSLERGAPMHATLQDYIKMYNETHEGQSARTSIK